MKKNPKQIVAVCALVAIVVLIAAFVISAFTAGPGEAGNRFMALLFCIIAIPILAWLMIFCIGRMQNKRTIAELFPEDEENKAK
jgi:cytochrome c biogenesis factor